ncbi:hypothetical protein Bbelb_092030 [Branchiostoma belcheri]|nr:hypothetical protein Bbelb_092030 [Branchiostoma belcheri]
MALSLRSSLHRTPRRSHGNGVTRLTVPYHRRGDGAHDGRGALIALSWRPRCSLRALANFRSQRERRESVTKWNGGLSDGSYVFMFVRCHRNITYTCFAEKPRPSNAVINV